MGLVAMLAYALINYLQIGCEIVDMIDMRRHSNNELICSEMEKPTMHCTRSILLMITLINSTIYTQARWLIIMAALLQRLFNIFLF